MPQMWTCTFTNTREERNLHVSSVAPAENNVLYFSDNRNFVTVSAVHLVKLFIYIVLTFIYV